MHQRQHCDNGHNLHFSHLLPAHERASRCISLKERKMTLNKDKNQNTNNTIVLPLGERELLTVNEASAYYNIGQNTIRTMTNGANNPFVFWIGKKRMIKRVPFTEYIRWGFSA